MRFVRVSSDTESQNYKTNYTPGFNPMFVNVNLINLAVLKYAKGTALLWADLP